MNITLKYPIVLSDGNIEKKIESIFIRRLKAKDLKCLPENFAEKEGVLSVSELLPLIASLTGLSIDEVNELDFADLKAIVNELQSFLS